jgi:predicted SAM-dependent methyltransferase
MILNLGCGTEIYGDVRVDFLDTGTTTHIQDLNQTFQFESNSFDKVYSNSVLEHIRNCGNFVDEIHRVLKKGGKFFIRTDNANYFGFLLKNHQSYIENTYKHHTEDDLHYYLFKEEHLRNLFKKFKDLKITLTCSSRKLFWLPNKLSCMHIEIRGIK